MNRISKYGISIFIVLAIMLAACDNSEDTIPTASHNSNYQIAPDSARVATVECAYVADGDTWYYYYENKRYLVRVLGIDCFETSLNERLANQAKKAKISDDSALSLGLQAKSLADSILKHRSIVIKRSISDPNRDAYDRLLRYCFVDSTKKYDSIIISRHLDANTFLE